MPTSPDEPTDPATSRPTPPTAPPDAYPFYIGDLKRAMRQHHDDLGAQVQSTLDDLTARWQPVRATLANTIQRLRRQMEAAQAQGDRITYAWLAQAERLAELKAAVAGNVAQFAEGARQIIGEGQETAITLGSQVAQEALAATVPAGINMVFGVPPSDVTDALAGALQPGTPLSNLFDGFGSAAAQLAQQALFTSVAIGEGPAQAAARLTWATDMSARRAEVIARTELARSWRSAQMANYRANSDVVAQWQWSADFGPRCCGACMAMDGTFHPLDEELDDHICGRCSALPVTRSWADILGDAGIDASNVSGLGGADGLAGLEETSLAAQRGGQNGREWFAQQSAEMQNAILGPAKAEAYRAGDLKLEQLIDYRYSPEWGWSLREASMADLGLDARAYLGAARGNGTADLASLHEQRAATERIMRELGAAERARAQEIKAAADAWYAGVAQAIGRAGGTPEQVAEAQAAAEAWRAQIEQAISNGSVPPGAYARDWASRREEAVAVAEGRASWLPQSVAGAAAAEVRTEAEAAVSAEISSAEISSEASRNAAVQEAVAPDQPNGLPSFTTDLGSAADIRAMDEAHGFFGADEHAYYEHEQVAERLGATLADNTDVRALMGKVEVYDAAAREMRDAQSPEEAIKQLLMEYHSGYANEAGPLIVAWQQAVANEFDLTARAASDDAAAVEQALTDYGDVLPGLQAIARQMYNDTQAYFDAAGITELDAFRGRRWRRGHQPDGIAWDKGPQELTISLRPMSSFSISPWNAATSIEEHASYLMVAGARVPVERILSIPQTGFGAFGEYEVLVLGGEDNYIALSLHDSIGASGGEHAYTREQLYKAFGADTTSARAVTGTTA